MRKGLLLGSALLLALALTISSASAALVFDQGFETDTTDWIAGGNYGAITRVASGTGGVTSFAGSNHAIVTQTASGPYTRFDGYRATWPGDYSASQAIYLDTAWATGTGFDYTVASSGSDGNHQRDFIFHVTNISGSGLLVAGSNNTNAVPRQDLGSLNHYTVGASGWYIFEHAFRDNGGALAVDLNLRDALGNLLFTETRSNLADTIPAEVGGNRYGWFTANNVANGLAIDNTQLRVGADDPVVPEPATLTLLGLGLAGLAGARRRRRA